MKKYVPSIIASINSLYFFYAPIQQVMKIKASFIAIGLLLVLVGCPDNNEEEPEPTNTFYKQEMRNFVQEISQYAKDRAGGFIIIPQNGQELVTKNGDDNGAPEMAYLNSIDGVGREDLFYGYDFDNEPTPIVEINYMIKFLEICEQNDVQVLVTDYCSTHSKMDDSYNQNNINGFISFAAPERDLNVIPSYPTQIFHENDLNIFTLSAAKNFLYLIDPGNFSSKQNFIIDLSKTNYDIIIMDMFFTEDEEFTSDDIESLRIKQNGGERLVIAYMSIGEAEDYRYYWSDDWFGNPPEWLERENPNWPGNFIVKYWMDSWQQIIYGNSNAYLDKILSKGFDGVYLDIIDAFEYFEDSKN